MHCLVRYALCTTDIRLKLYMHWCREWTHAHASVVYVVLGNVDERSEEGDLGDIRLFYTFFCFFVFLLIDWSQDGLIALSDCLVD